MSVLNPVPYVAAVCVYTVVCCLIKVLNTWRDKTYVAICFLVFYVAPTETSVLLLSLPVPSCVSLSGGFKTLQIPMKSGGKNQPPGKGAID